MLEISTAWSRRVKCLPRLCHTWASVGWKRVAYERIIFHTHHGVLACTVKAHNMESLGSAAAAAVAAAAAAAAVAAAAAAAAAAAISAVAAAAVAAAVAAILNTHSFERFQGLVSKSFLVQYNGTAGWVGGRVR